MFKLQSEKRSQPLSTISTDFHYKIETDSSVNTVYIEVIKQKYTKFNITVR